MSLENMSPFPHFVLPARRLEHRHQHQHQQHFHKRGDVAPSNLGPSATPTAAPTAGRANLGPLTTTFAPPASCTQPVLACATCGSGWQGQFCHSSNIIQDGPEDDTACWPRATSYTRSTAVAGFGFYSPGLICPTGYTTAATAVSQTGNAASMQAIQTPGPVKGAFQFPLVAGETAVGCCPTGYTVATYTTDGGYQACHAIATSTSINVATCAGASAQITNFALPHTSASATVSSLDLWAPMIQLNWQASDRPSNDVFAAGVPTSIPQSPLPSGSSASSTPHSASINIDSSPSPTPAPLHASPSAALDSPTPTSTISSAPLTIGAKAGIAVSTVILSLCFLSVGFYLYARKRWLRTPTKFDPAEAAVSKTISSPLRSPSTRSSSPILTPPVVITPGHAQAKEYHTPAAPARHLAPLSAISEHPQYSHPDASVFELGAGQGRKDGGKDVVKAEGGKMVLDMQAAKFGRGLGVEDDLESPIDGTSPFRLKRGNTLKRERERKGSAGSGVGLGVVGGGERRKGSLCHEIMIEDECEHDHRYERRGCEKDAW